MTLEPGAISYRSEGGAFAADPVRGGRWTVRLEVTVDRAVALSLAGQAWRLLFPEVDDG